MFAHFFLFLLTPRRLTMSIELCEVLSVVQFDVGNGIFPLGQLIVLFVFIKGNGFRDVLSLFYA